ncbi:MAG TPA: peptidoglycan editing factor PgeF [Thermoflexia bacterium]|nr:peptidoglycan editing factor PgeF [Thermoflexia bacterium]
MIRETLDNGIVRYRFETLDREDVVHAILTRLGGVSQGPFATLNLGHTVGDDLEAVKENHRRVFAALGIPRDCAVSPYQVHSANVRWVSQAHAGTVQPATDGLITGTPGLALLFRFADCVPVLLFDRTHRAIGLVHAGWRGAAKGVVAAAVKTFAHYVGSRPEDLWAGIGPAIGPCCYRVGSDVARAVARACPDGVQITQRKDDGVYLDLPGAVRAQLAAAGVGKVEMSGICTACHTEEWFSHRAERGRTGRFGVVMMLR